MMTNAKIGTALVGGYLLGRTKKAKLAIGLGMFLAGRKISLDPQAIRKLVADSPVLGALNTQVREEIIGATKTAATSALTKRVSGLADSLHERTLGLGDSGGSGDAAEDADETPDADDADGVDHGDDAKGNDGDDGPARADRAPQRKPAKRSASTGDSSSGGRRSASRPSGTRKSAASGARKTAARGSRGTSERGGSDA